MINRVGYVVCAVCAFSLLGLAGCNKPAVDPAAVTEPTPSPAPAAAPAPTSTSPATMQRVGDCVDTTITEIGGRLEGMPDSGTSILYANTASQVSYDVLADAKASKPGDKVKLCVTEVPKDCPAGDDRGFIYSAANERTGKSWTAANSQHMCGGA